MDCLCLAPASLLIFVHARPPISLDAPLAIAVMLVFAGAAALACARRMLYKPGGDPGGAYARVSSSDVRRQSSLQENLLDDDDYKEDEPPESRQLPFGSGTSRWWSAGGNLYSFELVWTTR